MKIELHIEELLLDGFDPRERHRIADAIERELSRILAEPGRQTLMERRQDSAHLDAGTVALPHPAPAADVGGKIARALTGALQRRGQ